MNEFCVVKISIDPVLLPHHGVVRGDAIDRTRDGRAAAALIVHEARDAAEAAISSAQQKALKDAAELLGALEQRHQRLLDGATEMVIALAQTLFVKLTGEMAPRERMTAMYTRVLAEAPRQLTRPVLWVHPDERALISHCEWEIRCDPAMSSGTCRLAAGEGEWRLDFQAGISALQAALLAASLRTKTFTHDPQEVNDGN